jgi:poly-gamma-glutamate synthesis protein (capsule biosynthesis protein)
VRSPRRRLIPAGICGALALIVAGCTSAPSAPSQVPTSTSPAARPTVSSRPAPPAAHARPAGRFTIAFAGDVHFAERIGARLDRDPATVFGQAAPVLRAADLTMVNLETAITSGGERQAKLFTFRAPAMSFVALRDAGIDVATMANNHGADYGTSGLRDSLAAIARYHFPVVGIGRDAAHAFAPYTTTLSGVRVAIIGADQVQDETTLRLFSAGPHSPGVANAYSPRLLSTVRMAKAQGYLVIVYVHWGIEFDTCPSADQQSLASALARAGATAIIGTHAHVLQGAGWLPGGAYVAYGLGNYLWWRTFGNDQDDNGVLTLTFRHDRVVRQSFAPAHLDDRGVPVPATGAEFARIHREWAGDRACTDLSARPPR